MKDKNAKTKKKTVKAKKVTKKVKSVKKKAKANKHAGSSFEDFMRLEQESFGLTTEPCSCTSEKGCLDPEPIEFKDHQVHDGIDNEAELTSESAQIHNEEPQISWFDSFMAIFGFKRKP